jgi:hypothetical protein
MKLILSKSLKRLKQATWGFFGFLLASGQIAAHHGTRISYDLTNPTQITGILTEYAWKNPHVSLFFDVTNEGGDVVNWGGEMGSPATLTRSRWTRTTLKPGDEITFTIYPSRAGANVGEVSRTHPFFANGVRLSLSANDPAWLLEGETLAPTEAVPVPQDVEYDPHDLTGIWASFIGPRRSVTGQEPAPMTPTGQAKYNSQLPSYGPRAIPPALGNDPAGECNPPGITRALLSISPFEFVQGSGKLIQLFEGGRTWRDIWVDGRELPEEQDPRWLGYSIGSWQGDTLVVETTGFDDRTWLDSYANPHSAAMRLVERWRRTDHDTLELDMTIYDPEIYTAPVMVETKPYALQPAREMQEVFCAPADEGSFNERIRNPAGGL